MNSFLEHKFTNLGTNSESNIKKYCQNESTSIFCPILDFIQSFYMLGWAKHIHKRDANYSQELGGELRILKIFQAFEYFFRHFRFSKIRGDKPEMGEWFSHGWEFTKIKHFAGPLQHLISKVFTCRVFILHDSIFKILCNLCCSIRPLFVERCVLLVIESFDLTLIITAKFMDKDLIVHGFWKYYRGDCFYGEDW